MNAKKLLFGTYVFVYLAIWISEISWWRESAAFFDFFLSHILHIFLDILDLRIENE